MKTRLKTVVCLGMTFGVSLALQSTASAGWLLTVTGTQTDQAGSTPIPRTDMNNQNPSTAGNLKKVLQRQYPEYLDAYYAAHVSVSAVRCGAYQKSSGVSDTVSGDKKWLWTWDGNPDQNVDEWAWDYSVKGMATADASVELDDNGGYGKIEAGSWVKVEADSLNSDPRESSVAVGAGAEVRADGGALTGFGIQAGADGGGISLSWESGGTQLDAYRSVTEYVIISELVRPGLQCWVWVHTSASATVGEFHDTFKYENYCTGFGGVEETYTIQNLKAPHFLP